MKKWYVVYTKENKEKNVGQFFFKKKLTMFSPKTKIETDNFLLNKTIRNDYIFKRNVFVQLDIHQLSIIKLDSNIINYLYWLGRPVVIDEFEINKLKAFVNKFPFIKTEKIAVNTSKRSYSISQYYYEYGEKIDEMKINYLNLPSIGFRLIAVENKISNQHK